MNNHADSCLSCELIKRYTVGDCSEKEQKIAKEHLGQCKKCRQKVEAIQSHSAPSENSVSKDSHRSDQNKKYKENLDDNGQAHSSRLLGVSTASFQAHSPNTREVSDVTFKGYHILEELPRGGQAMVYKAIHKATKTKVALKVLLPGLLISARARRYFEQEVELAARLSHPNIVTIRDSGIAQGQYYFAMEYIRGQPLDRHVNSQQLSVREKLILFGKICDAIAHAHQRGVIHRDLKPSNILVDESGEPHVLDFGLAKTAAGLSATSETADMLTITGQIKGTVAYMSPEQAAGRSDLVDIRSDVYSLGVILYEMFTGRFPYDVSRTSVAALENIQHAEPVRPRSMISRFDSDIEAIMLKALEKVPSQRYQSAAELRYDIQCWLDGFPIVAKSISSLYVLRKVVARHRYTSTVVALLLIIILGFSYISFYLRGLARNAQKEAELTATQWHNAALEAYSNARQANFLTMLEQWHEGDMRQAILFANLLGTGSKEKTVANVLLSPTTQNEDILRKRCSNVPDWLIDFAIGEFHLRNGYTKQALDAYQRSYQTIKVLPKGEQPALDGLLHSQVKARLYQLTATSESTSSASTRPQGE